MTETKKHRAMPGRRQLQAMTMALSVFVSPTPSLACTKAASGKCLPATCSFGRATFNKLAIGMSPLEAARTLGCEGKLEESSNAYGTLFEIYRFQNGEPGSGGLIDFHNSKLTDKVPIDLN